MLLHGPRQGHEYKKKCKINILMLEVSFKPKKTPYVKSCGFFSL